MGGLSHRARGGVAARWIVALAALGTVALTARLGWWQLDRAAQKDALQQEVGTRSLMPEVKLSELAQELSQGPAQHHRLARLQGQWMPQHTVFLDNRAMAGRAGFYVLTPLKLEDGTAVLVQRGWQPRDLRDRTLTQPVPGQADQTVRVRGRLAPPPSRLMEFEPAGQGAIRQNLDLRSFSSETGITIRPVTLLQLEQALVCDGDLAAEPDKAEKEEKEKKADGAVDTPGCSTVQEDGLRREWSVVASTSDKNRGYALQWFSLSALVLGLYGWFQWWAPRRPR